MAFLVSQCQSGHLVCAVVAISAPVSVASIKAARAAIGGRSTVNDVLLGCVSVALRGYLQRAAAAPGVKPFTLRDTRVIMPVNTRPLSAPIVMGNVFGVVSLVL